MPSTVHYSPRKLVVMAAVCAILLPLLSPTMLLAGPGAIVLVPLFLLGGPVCAVPCLVRAVGDRKAVHVGTHDVTIRTLWRTVEVPLPELRDVRLDLETVRWLVVVPVAWQRHLVVVLGRDEGPRREVRLPLNLLALDEDSAGAFVTQVRRDLARRGVRGR